MGISVRLRAIMRITAFEGKGRCYIEVYFCFLIVSRGDYIDKMSLLVWKMHLLFVICLAVVGRFGLRVMEL